ncbi:unnamed protein product [Hermetia illucens]|uniref:Uncharacterized protein n=1 Tax=Hermetia illucens TaxID=343691 RepID=A0A7R8UYY5_HERIL|nr:glutathione S-transferase 1-like [Hermetia illucens]CAD7089144.1 unnamed protein product [Hermetia illucens]
MGKPILYGMEISTVVRSVLMVAKAIDLDIEYREIDLFAGDHLKEEYLKMNPQHTIPTLDDNGEYLWESHAIAPYLVEKYAKDDSLFPKNDIRKRARINQCLHFDNGVLYERCILNIVMPVYTENKLTISPETIDNVNKAYEHMEKFLEKDLYLVRGSLTIADLACGASISALFEFVPADPAKYPKLHAWFERIKALPYYKEANEKGNIAYIKKVRDVMAKGKQ